MLIHLAIHPEWKEKCKEEIRGLLTRHSGDSDSSATLCEKLGSVPLSAWEDELPILDACIRESQRIILSINIIRRNLGEDMKFGDKVVRRGDFLVYSTSDVHLNPEYYPDPYKYDPNRWLQPELAPKCTYPFLGWGAGRHICTGMKLAKLEMKLVLAVFLTRYEFDLVDKYGKFPDTLPVPDRNNYHKVREVVNRLGRSVRHIASPSLFRLFPLEIRVTSTSRRLCSRLGGCATDSSLPLPVQQIGLSPSRNFPPRGILANASIPLMYSVTLCTIEAFRPRRV